MTINVPKLSERPGDIKPLSEYFCRKYSESNGLGEVKITAATNELLTDYSWPGNVRELENIIHRGVLLSVDGTIVPESISVHTTPDSSHEAQLGEPVTSKNSGTSLVGKTVAEVEQELILDTLNHCLGNRTHAANILGISIRTLRIKLKLYTEQSGSIPSPSNGNEQAAT